MAYTVEQLLATLAVDAATAEVQAGRYVIVQRDPQPDEGDVALATDLAMLVVDLDADPTDPAAAVPDFAVTADGVLVMEWVAGAAVLHAGWGGGAAANAVTDPFVFVSVALTQPVGGSFVSEQVVLVEVDVDSGVAVFTYEFTIQDLTPPRLLAAEAVAPELVRVTFDDEMAVSGAGSVADLSNWVGAVETRNVDPAPGVDLEVESVSASDVPGPLHVPLGWTFADAAERAAYAPVAADVGKLAFQQSDSSYWMLTAAVPTWVAVSMAKAHQYDLGTQWEHTPGCLYRLSASAALTDAHGNAMDSAFQVVEFQGFVPERQATRHFEYADLCVPVVNRQNDATRDLERFTNCIQEVLTWVLYDLDRFTDQFDPDLASSVHLDLMLYDMGNPFDADDFGLTVNQKRKLLRMLLPIYTSKGTALGIEQAILLLLGEAVQVVPYLADGWILGVDTLGGGSIAQVVNDVPETYDFTTVAAPWEVEVEVDGGAPQVVTFAAGDFSNPAAATAAEVVAVIVAQLAGGGAYVVEPGQPAQVAGAAAEPFAVSPGDALEVLVDGDPVPLVATMTAADIGTPGAATAQEIADRINGDMASVAAFAVSGVLVLQTVRRGVLAELQVNAGVVQAAAGLGLVAVTGTDLPQVAVYSGTAGRDAVIQVTGGSVAVLLGFDGAPQGATGGSVLAPSDSYTRYSFDIETAAVVSSETERKIREIAEYMKPAHTHLINVRTAKTLPWPDGWQLGVSTLDESTELGP